MKIVIPAYQPDHRLLLLIKEIKANSDYDIILVNDGSENRCDSIFERAKEFGCIVLTHKFNQGKGAALKTAFAYSAECNESEGIICADCDGQHSWRDIQKLADAIPQNPSSIILGCRKFSGDVPLKSLFGNKITRAVFTLITGNKIADTQTGLRGFSAAALPWLMRLSGNRYEYEMNQLLEASVAGYDLCCIPIDTVYEDDNLNSHFHPIRDSIRVYLPIIKFRMSSILCGIIDFSLLLILNWMTRNLLFSVVISRIVSSLCNFLLNKMNWQANSLVMNKNLVFQTKKERTNKIIMKYYSLAAGILICNYLLLFYLSNALGLSLFFSKLLTECILFFISYFAQRKFIF